MENLHMHPMDLGLFVAFVSFCLFFNKNKLGLIGTFIFASYLGFVYSLQDTILVRGETSWWAHFYVFAGLALTCLFVVALLGKKPILSKAPNPTETDTQQ